MKGSQGEAGVGSGGQAPDAAPSPASARESRLRSQLQALAQAGLGGEPREDAGGLLSSVLEKLRTAFRCEAGNLYLRQERELVLLAARNERVSPTELSARQDEVRPLDRRSPAGYAVFTGGLLHVPDVSQLTGEPGYDPRYDPPGFHARSLVALPLVEADGEVCGVLELINPAGELSPAELNEIERLSDPATRAVQAERLERGYLAAVFDLAAGVESGDPEIHGHVRRISGYSAALARAAGCTPTEVRWIRLASPLHDIGKVGIPDEILYKPGKLSEQEFAITQRHCEMGHTALLAAGESALFRVAAEIARSHHERWDGQGYPDRSSGEGIPLAARVVAIADVFDALTTRRIYKPALGIEQSLRIVRQESEKHFDPALVEAFQGVFAEILDVKSRCGGDGG